MLSNAYIAHFNAPKFFYELKDRTLGRFNQVVGWSFGASVLLYSIISGLGFLTFGAASNGLILNNYSTKDVLMGFSRIAVALSVIGRYVVDDALVRMIAWWVQSILVHSAHVYSFIRPPSSQNHLDAVIRSFL